MPIILASPILYWIVHNGESPIVNLTVPAVGQWAGSLYDSKIWDINDLSDNWSQIQDL